MQACWYGVKNKDYESIIEHWNNKKNVSKMIGKIGGNLVQDNRAEFYLNDVSEYLFKVPFNSDFAFDSGQVNRFKREIDKIENNYKSKKIGAFRKYFYVPDAIANYSPVTRVFYEKVNEAINFERNSLDYYLAKGKDVSDHILKALVTRGMSKGESKKYLKKIADLEARIFKGEDTTKNLELYDKLYQENGKDVLSDYIKLMEMSKKEYSVERFGYDSNIVLAVDSSRKLLNKMGNVLTSGLERMANVVKDKYNSPLLSKSSQSYVDKIIKAKNTIDKNIKKGGYMPHYLLENTVEMNYKMKQLLEAKTENQINVAATSLLENISNIETMLPGKAQGKNEMLNNIWSKNPFWALTQYSKDVIAFNKINFIQEQYIPAIRRFQREDVNPEFIRSMRLFIDDTFQISTKGLMERPNWVNATVRGLMAAETLKSMGLSVTGAIRNGASAAYFFMENGVFNAQKAIGKYHSEYKEKLTKIEEEQGFQFTEAGRELVAEGLIPSSVNLTDIVFDPLTQKVTYRDKGVLKTLDPLIDRTVGMGLIFHRFTENMTRNWMFRIAWVQSYEALRGKNLIPKKTMHAETKEEFAALSSENINAIERKATNFALKTVNKFAFEYAAHAKARAVGGTAPMGEIGPDGLPVMKARDKFTAMGELTFQFMHYPMSFLNLQSKILVGAKDAALSGQWNAPEIKQALRFAGVYGSVSLLSIMTNLDFANLLENDSVEKIKDLAEYLTEDEKELEGKKRGLINDFTGPIVGDILYGMNMFQLTSMPDERWQKMLLGYIDYYDEGQVPDWVGPEKKIDTEEKRHMWNKLNTELARFVTKTWPAMRDGRGVDIFRHELGLYPRKWIKERRKGINKVTGNSIGWKPFAGKGIDSDNTSKKKQAEVNLMRLVGEIGK